MFNPSGTKAKLSLKDGWEGWVGGHVLKWVRRCEHYWAPANALYSQPLGCSVSVGQSHCDNVSYTPTGRTG